MEALQRDCPCAISLCDTFKTPFYLSENVWLLLFRVETAQLFNDYLINIRPTRTVFKNLKFKINYFD